MLHSLRETSRKSRTADMRIVQLAVVHLCP